MKTALVTGASSGIGKAFAEVLAREGYDLVLVARRKHLLEKIRERLENDFGVSVTLIVKDLAIHDSTQAIFDLLQKKKITVDILINNAGFGDFGHFVERDWKHEQQMIQLNVIALTHFTKLFAQEMVARRSGRIVNVASVAAFFPGPLMNVYYSTKAYVLHFSEALANELDGSGVSVTALCPGRTQSGFQEAARMNDTVGRVTGGPTAYDVALYGYKEMLQGTRIAVPGWKNKILVFLPRLLPRSLAVYLVRKFQDVKK